MDQIPIKLSCDKCGHSADVTVTKEQMKQSNRFVCTKCGAKGWDLLIRHKMIASNYSSVGQD